MKTSFVSHFSPSFGKIVGFICLLFLIGCSTEPVAKRECPELPVRIYTLSDKKAQRTQQTEEDWGSYPARLKVKTIRHYKDGIFKGMLEYDSIRSPQTRYLTKITDSLYDQEGRLSKIMHRRITRSGYVIGKGYLGPTREDTSYTVFRYHKAGMLLDSVLISYQKETGDSTVTTYSFSYDTLNRPVRFERLTKHSDIKKGGILTLKKLWRYAPDSSFVASVEIQAGEIFQVYLQTYDSLGRRTGKFYTWLSANKQNRLEAKTWTYKQDTLIYRKYSRYRNFKDFLDLQFFAYSILRIQEVPDLAELYEAIKKQLACFVPDEETHHLYQKDLIIRQYDNPEIYTTFAYDTRDSLIRRQVWEQKLTSYGCGYDYADERSLITDSEIEYDDDYREATISWQRYRPVKAGKRFITRDKAGRVIEDKFCDADVWFPGTRNCRVIKYEYDVSCADSSISIETYDEGRWQRRERKIYNPYGQLVENELQVFQKAMTAGERTLPDRVNSGTYIYTYDHKGVLISTKLIREEKEVSSEEWEIEYYE